ncbi:peptidase M16 [Longibacter salinarum]|uniref:Peptidase M16 n=1 Tax=Longibacter salinarum TaxID=1850348 RepID=A0A2A8D2U7_9BACT|nr:pitrilysin family protein [Longibacter salinarum]PEN15269.1 peptidase M16 [Longibacter salinarum]
MSSSPSFANRVQDRHVGPCQLLTLPTPVENFVSFKASFVTNPDFAAGDDIRQDLAVALLDKGTASRDRFEIARVLEDRGAKISISSDGLYIDISGKALTDDFAVVLDVLSEMLQEPLFDPKEFEKARASTIADLQRQLEQTSSQAAGALSRRLFPEDHPNYTPPTEELIEQAQALTLDEVRDYYNRHVGATDFRMAVVGDLDHKSVEESVLAAFSDWEPHESEAVHAREASPQEPGRSLVPMADRSNVDVRIGHPLDFYRDSDDYEAFYVANYILGGNFSARLMNQVRDEQGLTYHIGSSMSGVTVSHQGAWRTVVTLSSESLERGIEATIDVIRDFVEHGPTAEELATVKETITGSFVVGLATTGNLAQTLLTNAERGFDVEYIDRFPELIEGVTLEEVTEVTQRHLHPDRLHVGAAGTLPEPVRAE